MEVITTLKGQNFRDACGRVKAVLRQQLDERQPKSPIPADVIYEKCFEVIDTLEIENNRLRKELGRKEGKRDA